MRLSPYHHSITNVYDYKIISVVNHLVNHQYKLVR